ncbi:MAG: hypothetical protein NVSMB46_05170 [Candidatus Saccharimonadales bacterium]
MFTTAGIISLTKPAYALPVTVPDSSSTSQNTQNGVGAQSIQSSSTNGLQSTDSGLQPTGSVNQSSIDQTNLLPITNLQVESTGSSDVTQSSNVPTQRSSNTLYYVLIIVGLFFGLLLTLLFYFGSQSKMSHPLLERVDSQPVIQSSLKKRKKKNHTSKKKR